MCLCVYGGGGYNNFSHKPNMTDRTVIDRREMRASDIIWRVASINYGPECYKEISLLNTKNNTNIVTLMSEGIKG